MFLYVDYFSVDDPFTHDLEPAELDKIAAVYGIGQEAPGDLDEFEKHDTFQRRRMAKISKMEVHLKTWDAQRDKFDALADFDEPDDRDVSKLFGIWKRQREMTKDAILVSGENPDFEMKEGWLIHNAGCTTNNEGPSLPVHISSNAEIVEMIAQFAIVVNKQVHTVFIYPPP